MATRIQLRRDTAANWTSVDPVLGAGEEGYESDTGKRKVGDGVSLWSALPYSGGEPDPNVYPAGNTAGAADGHVWTYDAASGGWIAAAAPVKSVNGKAGEVSLAAADVGAAPSASPFPNAMPDSGRFTGKVDPLAINTSAAFTASSFFSPFNSSTAFASAGKFINNNTTNGGTRGTLTQDVIDLLAAMGRAGDRYGAEFYVGQSTMGSGTAAAYNGRYAWVTNGGKALFAFDNTATAAFWVRIKSGADVLIRRQTALFRGGSELAGDAILTPADGWTHVLAQQQLASGFADVFPFLYANAGDVIQVACPAFFAGPANPGVHRNPLPTINELAGN